MESRKESEDDLKIKDDFEELLTMEENLMNIEMETEEHALENEMKSLEDMNFNQIKQMFCNYN